MCSPFSAVLYLSVHGTVLMITAWLLLFCFSFIIIDIIIIILAMFPSEYVLQCFECV